ncbi:major facilitator superfamily domain-containing protein 8-like [Aplysia californica]|uniref:Major facilitator superfamily domain-containing protein 8-like n=1 Tax=Aplysia californica TaxID=6500 RepID=A0ABM1VYE1_APLCA|nr:major facilitator superfamily domain-containing protein 8-like [Aplysia californica]
MNYEKIELFLFNTNWKFEFSNIDNTRLNPAADADLMGWAVSAYSLGQLIASPFFGTWANWRNSTKEPLLLNPAADADLMGWAVSAYSLGQLIASPFFGTWANWRNSTKEPLLVCLVLSCLSYIVYMYLDSLPDHRDYFMIACRCLIGLSAGFESNTEEFIPFLVKNTLLLLDIAEIIPRMQMAAKVRLNGDIAGEKAGQSIKLMSSYGALIRSYVSGATTIKERTAAMANLNISCTTGFILGPALQAVLVLLKYPGPIESAAFHLNMYTCPTLIAALSSLVSIVLLCAVFKSHPVSSGFCGEDNESFASIQVDGEIVRTGESRPGMYASLPQAQFVTGFDCAVHDGSYYCQSQKVLSTPLVMHMYGWTKSETTLIRAITTGCSSFCAILVYVVVKWLSARFAERMILVGGSITLFGAFFVFIPWGGRLPPLGLAPVSSPAKQLPAPEINNLTTTTPSFADLSVKGFELSPSLSRVEDTTTTVSPNVTYTPEGCPWNYPWCVDSPQLPLAQYIVGVFLFAMGSPTTHVLSVTIFSKLLGPGPQGTWMGVFLSAGCLAGMLGPIPAARIYDWKGPRVLFGVCCAVIAICILVVLLVYQRLVPYSTRRVAKTVAANGKIPHGHH